jgi:hypothetical protein
MIQIVENWANVTGVVEKAARDPAMPDHAHIRLHLTGAENVGGSPNLFRQHLGEDIDLLLRDEAHAVALVPGARIAVRARIATPDRAFGAADDLIVLG